MPQFKIQPAEKEVVGKATFTKESDYKVVKLSLGNGRTKNSLLHVVQADKLIKEKKATHVKDVDIELVESERTVVKVKKKN